MAVSPWDGAIFVYLGTNWVVWFFFRSFINTVVAYLGGMVNIRKVIVGWEPNSQGFRSGCVRISTRESLVASKHVQGNAFLNLFSCWVCGPLLYFLWSLQCLLWRNNIQVWKWRCSLTNSEQLNYWSEEQDGKEVAQGISHETAREVRDVAELVNEYDALTQEHHEGKNTSKAKGIFPFGLTKMENDDSYGNQSNGDSFIQNSDWFKSPNFVRIFVVSRVNQPSLIISLWSLFSVNFMFFSIDIFNSIKFSYLLLLFAWHLSY